VLACYWISFWPVRGRWAKRELVAAWNDGSSDGTAAARSRRRPPNFRNWWRWCCRPQLRPDSGDGAGSMPALGGAESPWRRLQNDPADIPLLLERLDQANGLSHGLAPPAPGCGAAAGWLPSKSPIRLDRPSRATAPPIRLFAQVLPREGGGRSQPLMATCNYRFLPALPSSRELGSAREGEPPRPRFRQAASTASIAPPGC